jgi:hypothetical protein
LRKRNVLRANPAAVLVATVAWTGLTRSDDRIKKSTAHDVRAQSRKEESNYKLAILAAASLSAGSSRIASAEIVVFHIALILATTVI